jgi:hypothetical protein
VRQSSLALSLSVHSQGIDLLARSRLIPDRTAYQQCAEIQLALGRLEATLYEHMRDAVLKPVGRALEGDFTVPICFLLRTLIDCSMCELGC